MGILSNIFSKIFPSSHPASTQADNPPESAPPQQTAPTTPTAPATPAGAAIEQVDVEAILNGMSQQAGESLNWRTSIVDLLKLLNLDSSLQARKALAQELHFSGDTNDSAAMNVWLHRQVMAKLAANGGKVPAELRD